MAFDLSCQIKKGDGWWQKGKMNHIISEICNSNILEVIMIANNSTLLDNEHQFMESPHIVDNRS